MARKCCPCGHWRRAFPMPSHCLGLFPGRGGSESGDLRPIANRACLHVLVALVIAPSFAGCVAYRLARFRIEPSFGVRPGEGRVRLASGPAKLERRWALPIKSCLRLGLARETSLFSRRKAAARRSRFSACRCRLSRRARPLAPLAAQLPALARSDRLRAVRRSRTSLRSSAKSWSGKRPNAG